MDERAPLSDEALDRELQQALAVDAPADLAARVRLRVAHETMAPAWWEPRWIHIWGAAGAVAASAVAVVMMVSSSPEAPVSTPVIPARALAVPMASAAPAVAAPAPVYVASGFSRTTRIELSVVIVPPGQERALRMFAEAVWQQHVEPTAAPGAARDEPLEIAPLAFAPIDIDPLPQMAALEGERP